MPAAQDRTSRTRRARSLRTALLVALVVAVTACTGPAGQVAGAQRSDTAAAPSPAATTGPTDAPTGPAGAPSDPDSGCGDDVDAMDAVITRQLAAFTAGDWDGAYALTSRQFRAGGVDADGLREIVTSGYAAAADAERHEVQGCVRTGPEAQVLIEITAGDGATLGLVYLMTREDGRWRISGAVQHGTGGSEPATIPA